MLAGHSIADAARRSGWNPRPVARWAVVSSRAVQHGLSRDIGPSRQRLVRHSVCWWRVERVWQAAVEMPRDKQVLAFRPQVGKSTPQLIHDSLVVADGEESPGKEKKSRDESRLSRLDSLRHRLSEQYCP